MRISPSQIISIQNCRLSIRVAFDHVWEIPLNISHKPTEHLQIKGVRRREQSTLDHTLLPKEMRLKSIQRVMEIFKSLRKWIRTSPIHAWNEIRGSLTTWTTMEGWQPSGKGHSRPPEMIGNIRAWWLIDMKEQQKGPIGIIRSINRIARVCRENMLR